MATLMLLLGAPPTLRFVVFPELKRRGLDTTRADGVALTVVGTSLIGAAFAATAITIANVRPSDAGSFAVWATTASAGWAWVALVAIAAILGTVTVGRYLRPGSVPRRRWLAVVSFGALAMLVAFCATRYSVAVDNPAVAVLVKVGHMTGAALWVGGLVVLAVLPALIPRDPGSDEVPARFVLSAVRRFSIIAVAGVTIAFATGIIIAAWHVPTPSALVTTSYGVLLSAKVGLVVIAALLGGFNRLVVHERIARSVAGSNDPAVLPGMLTVAAPRIEPTDAVSTITRSVRVELVVLVAATALSVVLTTAITPSYELLEPPVTASTDVFGIIELADLCELSAVGIGLSGSLALGYEVGKFDDD